MKTIRWITPRILYQERIDSFGETFGDISYGLWDVADPRVYCRALEMIQNNCHVGQAKIPWFSTASKEVNVEERRFIRPATGLEEQLETPAYKQFFRNFASIWNWRPEIEDFVVRDLKLLAEEDPEVTKEWHRWYNWRRYGAYRKPGFYEKDLANKVPIRE